MAKRPSILLLILATGVFCSPQGTLRWRPGVQDLQESPVGPLGSVASVKERIHEKEVKASRSGYEEEKKERVGLNDTLASSRSLSCNTHSDCLSTDVHMVCVEGVCTCRPPTCLVYHMEVSGWYSKYVFNCGTCGELGSICNETITCSYPGSCFNDGFCHCTIGENFNNICIVTDNSWMYLIALGGLGIIFIFAIAMVLYSVYKDPPWRRNRPWCFGLCNAQAGRDRRGSMEKSPAFTIQSLYTNQVEQISVETGGAVARQGSRSMENEHPTASGDNRDEIREETGSITSETTQMTNLSLRSINSNASTASTAVIGAECSPLPFDEAEENENLKSESESIRSEESMGSLSSGCSHERCTLCLPKGLSTRSPVASSPRASPKASPKASPSPLGHSPRARRSPRDNGEPDFQCTSL